MLERPRVATHAGRRAGKTTAEAAVALWDTGEQPFVPQFYMTLTRVNAKKIFWPELLDLNARYKLNCEINHSELWIRRPGGAPLFLIGADNERELEKVRGGKFKRGILDEAGHFRFGFVESLIKTQLKPALVDYGGKLVVSGTPGMTRSGFFFDVCQGVLRNNWDVHHWTLADNPMFPGLKRMTAEQIFIEERREFGWTEDDPTFRREYLGEFIEDSTAMLYQYDPSINGVDLIDRGGEWTTVMGIDLGADDTSAVAVWGWQRHDQRLRLLVEIESAGDGATDVQDVVDMVRPVMDRWSPVAMVIDQGGLGKMVANEIRSRHEIPVEPADKTQKGAHIKLLNADLRKGKLIVDRGGIWARDVRLVERDPRALVEGKLQEKPGGYHSNITDAALYAWRHAQHYLETPAEREPTDDEKMFDARIEQMQRDVDADPWESTAEALGYD